MTSKCQGACSHVPQKPHAFCGKSRDDRVMGVLNFMFAFRREKDCSRAAGGSWIPKDLVVPEYKEINVSIV